MTQVPFFSLPIQKSKPDAEPSFRANAVQMNTLIARAEECVKKANTDVSFKRPDRAYVEWLISSDIILNHIPRHRDWPALNRDRGELQQRYQYLYKVSSVTNILEIGSMTWAKLITSS